MAKATMAKANKVKPIEATKAKANKIKANPPPKAPQVTATKAHGYRCQDRGLQGQGHKG